MQASNATVTLNLERKPIGTFPESNHFLPERFYVTWNMTHPNAHQL
jgi:hypothetical protein